MFVKYSAVTAVLCTLMLGYLHLFMGAESSPEYSPNPLGIAVRAPEETKTLENGEALFIVTVENSGTERDLEFMLEKEMPNGWQANFCFEDICFLDHTTHALESGKDLEITIGVTPDYDRKEEGTVRFFITGEDIQYEKTFHVTADVEETPYRYTITGEKEQEVEASKPAEFVLTLTNTGERDSYTFTLGDELPQGWKASLSEKNATLEKNEAREVHIYIRSSLDVSGGEEGTVSLRITPEHAEERKISLKSVIRKDYNFKLWCLEPKKYTQKNYDVIFSIEITNTGNSPDTYLLTAEEGLLSENEITLSPGEKYIFDLTLYSVQDNMVFSVSVVSQSGSEKGLELSVQMGDLTKKVFAELFTATWCHTCPEAQAGMEEIEAEYGEKVFYIQYHPGDTPETNMRREVSEIRFAYYTPKGYPTVYFNGIHEVIGGYEGVADAYRSVVDEELQKDDTILMDLTYANGELKIRITPLLPLPGEYDLFIVTYKDVTFKTMLYPNVAQEYVERSIDLEEETVLTVPIAIEEGAVVFIQKTDIVDFEIVELN
jgi:thiol-disulfide isomerase/thioredoxin/uncharacterized cupredoxin-like copper-binding protein